MSGTTVKKFNVYQYVPGTPMSDRDKKEKGSKFWNQGKWDNFVLPFLPKNCQEMTFIDVGCNAGLFLKYAEDMGFRHVIGVEADPGAYKKAVAYRKANGGQYRIIRKHMEKVIDELPVADYTVLANTHYYFKVHDWLDYLDHLIAKTRYCIIVTAAKKERRYVAPSDTNGIRNDFRDWQEMGYIPELPLERDPFPRRQWSFCFKSPLIERVPIESLDCGNHVQDSYYEELDKGRDPLKTKYYKILKRYRKGKWSDEKLARFMDEKKRLYESVKKNGILKPLLVNSKQRIVDGNHKYSMLKRLGYKTVLIRKVL